MVGKQLVEYIIQKTGQVVNDKFDTRDTQITELEAENERLKEDINGMCGTKPATGENLNINDSAEMRFVKFGLSGNSKQETSKITYTCVGTETGTYYLTYNNINYQFTMPTIESDDILIFDTKTLKLYLGETEITTEAGTSGTQLTFNASPSPDYPQEISSVDNDNELYLLPKEYQQVEYIKSDGNSFIDTGLVLGDGYEIDIDFIINGWASNEQPILSIWNTQDGYWNLFINSGHKLNMYVKGHNNFNTNLVLHKKYHSTLSRNGNNFNATLDGETKSIVQSVTENNTTLKILRRGDLNADKSYCSVGNIIVKQNDIVIMELVPCYHQSSNEIGMYDIVTNTFFTNSGTGTFEKGRNVGINAVVTNKNLINFNEDNYNWSTGKCYIKGDKVIFTGAQAIDSSDRNNTKYKINIPKNTPVTWSIRITENAYNYVTGWCIINPVFIFGDGTTYYANNTGWGNPNDRNIVKTYTVTFEKDIVAMLLNVGASGVFASGDTTSTITVGIQLEYGNTATEYTTHKSQTYTIPIQQQMRKIGDYADTFVKENGVWYEKHYIDRVVLDGTESWEIFDNNTKLGLNSANYNSISNVKINNVNSSGNLTQIKSNRYVSGNQVEVTPENNKLAFAQWGDAKLKFLYIGKIKDTIADFKTWVTENNIEVCFPIETPLLLPCTQAQTDILEQIAKTAKTYKGTTNIYSTNKVSPIFDVEYRVDKLAELEARIEELEGGE